MTTPLSRESRSGEVLPAQSGTVPYHIDANLLQDIMAALAFLWHDELPEHVYDALTDPSDATLAAISKLVGIRRGQA